MHSAKCLAQISSGECGRYDAQAGALACRVVQTHAHAASLNVGNDDRNLVALEAVDNGLAFFRRLATADDVGAVELRRQSADGFGEVHQQDHALPLFDSGLGHFHHSRHFVQLDGLAGAEDKRQVAGFLRAQGFGNLIELVTISFTFCLAQLVLQVVVLVLNRLGLTSLNDGGLDDGFREVRDVGDAEAATTQREDSVVQLAQALFIAAELHAEEALTHAIPLSPVPVVVQVVEAKSEAKGSHFKRVAGGGGRAQEDAAMTSAGSDE